MKNKSGTLLLAAVLSIAAAWPCLADVPNPDPVDLGVLPQTNHDTSRPFALNGSGQIVGISYHNVEGIYLPFIWQKGVMTQLPMPSGYDQGYGVSINASGLIAGICQTGADMKACVWTPTKKGGWTTNLLTLPSPYEASLAFKINDAGQVLTFLASSTAPAVAAIWQSGNWTLLTNGTDTLNLKSMPTQMNNKGQVLLYIESADTNNQDLWVWDTGVLRKALERISYGNFNDLGQVVGRFYSIAASREESFTYDIATNGLTPYDFDYSFTNISNNGTIAVANNNVIPAEIGTTIFTNAAAVDIIGSGNADLVLLTNMLINTNGEMGGCGTTPGTAFYASFTTGVMPLNDLVQPTGMDSTEFIVTAMNDNGMIIGQSDNHAILWCAGPITETATATRKNKTVTVTVPIKNMNSAVTAYNVAVTDVTMDGGILTSPLPAFHAINPGQTAIATFRFSSNTGSGELKMTGISSLGAFSTTQTVTVP